MQYFTQTLDIPVKEPTHSDFSEIDAAAKILLIDIETTGLSPRKSIVYLIGCACCESGKWILHQWFAEKESEEIDILKAFLEFAAAYDLFITFNGAKFDIPFLRGRLDACELKDTTLEFGIIDIYRVLKPFRKILKAPSLRQLNVEKLCGFERKDILDGLELINIYKNYTDISSPSDLSAILLHNGDDVRGMIYCLKLLCLGDFETNLDSMTVIKAYSKKFEDFYGNASSELYMEAELSESFPVQIDTSLDSCFLHIKENKVRLRVPLYEKELKYFYSNWRDYYYLPYEDTALHKSVAEYVSRSNRIKASASNCYTKKKGCFLKQWELIAEPCFREAYNGKDFYFEVTDTVKKDRRLLSSYAIHVMKHIMML